MWKRSVPIFPENGSYKLSLLLNFCWTHPVVVRVFKFWPVIQKCWLLANNKKTAKKDLTRAGRGRWELDIFWGFLFLSQRCALDLQACLVLLIINSYVTPFAFFMIGLPIGENAIKGNAITSKSRGAEKPRRLMIHFAVVVPISNRKVSLDFSSKLQKLFRLKLNRLFVVQASDWPILYGFDWHYYCSKLCRQ